MIPEIMEWWKAETNEEIDMCDETDSMKRILKLRLIGNTIRAQKWKIKANALNEKNSQMELF